MKRTEKKVDKLLISPLKSAIDHLDTAVNMMISKKFMMANNTLEKVIDKATDGLNNVDCKEISIDTFRECGTAIKLIILSKLLVFSYDLKLEIFLPHFLLSASTQELISKEIETLGNRYIGLRRKVRIGIMFDDKSKKKCEAEYILDTILQVVYPYIIRCHKMSSVISPEQFTKEILVRHKYLPTSDENKAHITVGFVNYNSFLNIGIWKSGKSIFVQLDDNHKAQETVINTDIGDMKLTIKMPITISGEGPIEKRQGSCFGQYQYGGEFNDSPYYVQLHNLYGEHTNYVP